MVRDALVAIDAGFFAREQEALVSFHGTRTLTRNVHRLGAVAVAAFERVVCLHPRPLMDRKLKTLIDKLLACIDRAEKLSSPFLWRLHLAGDLGRPGVRDMAIGAMRAHA